MSRDLKFAILERVTDLLDDVRHVESLSVDIYYSADEVPAITYRVKEFIVPDLDGHMEQKVRKHE